MLTSSHHVDFTWINDSAKSHLTAKVADAANRLGIKKIFIPPCLTNLLQTADVCWFAVFKKSYNQKWNEWAFNPENELSIRKIRFWLSNLDFGSLI